MRIRTKEISGSVSIRLNKEEWKKILNEGDKVFSNRNVGYLQIAEGKIKFDTSSTYFKDMKELDKQDEEFSMEEKTITKSVTEEIKLKKVGKQ